MTTETKKPLFERMMDALRSGGEQAARAVLATRDSEAGEHIGGHGGVVIHVNGGPNGSTTHAPTADEKEEEERKRKEAEDADMPPWFKKHVEDSMNWRQGFDSRMKKMEDWMKARDAGPAEEREDEEIAEGEAEGESEGDILSLDSGDDEEELEKEEVEAMDRKKPVRDKKKKTKDSAVVAAAKQLYQDTISGAEILSPGLKLPTFDSITGPKLVDQMCLLKRRAIRAHAATKDGARALGDITGAKTLNLSTMDCAAVGLLFNGAVAFAKDRNGREELDLGSAPRRRQTADFQPPASPAEFNAKKNAFWAKQAQH